MILVALMMTCCRLLLANGADVRSLDRLDVTALHVAAAHSPSSLEVLLERLAQDIGGSDGDVAAELSMAVDSKQRTPLHWAAKVGGEAGMASVRVLFATGANPLARDSEDRTPLALAARAGHGHVIEAMLSHPSCGHSALWMPDSLGYLPLHLAAQNGHHNIICLLLSPEGICVETPDESNQWTPLHICAASGHVEAARVCLDLGAKIDSLDVRRATPCHVAAEHGQAAVLSLLVSEGGVRLLDIADR
jgi:ankyrin repeat protein